MILTIHTILEEEELQYHREESENVLICINKSCVFVLRIYSCSAFQSPGEYEIEIKQHSGNTVVFNSIYEKMQFALTKKPIPLG